MFNIRKNSQTKYTDFKKYDNYEKKLYRKYGNADSIDFNIELLTIADTHNTIKDISPLKNIKYDICVLLGDISKQDIQEILKFVDISKIIGILGNHDEKDNLLKYNICNVNDTIFQFNDIKFAGIEGCIKYKENQPGYSLAKSFKISNELEKADILLTHTIPYQFMGTLNEFHIGNPAITNYLYKNKCPLNLCGHNHNEKLGTLKNGTNVIETYMINLISVSPKNIKIQKIETSS